MRSTPQLTFYLVASNTRERGERERAGLSGTQVRRGGLSAPPIRLGLKGHFLTFAQSVHAGPLDRSDVHEHVLTATVRGNEAKTLVHIEKLHRANSHYDAFLRRHI